jgi:hypothetical protein
MLAPQGALVAACLALGCGCPLAQTAAPSPDPFAPKLTYPAQQPRFRNLPAPSRPGQPTTFAPFAPTPAASGAGTTGFDSTNARKKAAPKPRESVATDTAIAPQAAAPVPPSPYQTPPPGTERPPADEGTAALAAAPPGTPPVEPIEEIRPPKRKPRPRGEAEDPFAAVGLRAGAFDLYPAVELSGGYNTNPGQSSQGQGAAVFVVAPELKVQSNWSRHELKADLRGNYTAFTPEQTPKLSRPYFNGKIDGRIDVTRDTRIDLSGGLLLSTDNPGSPNVQADLVRLPIFTTLSGGAGLGQRFNRLDLSLKGEVARTVYQNSELTDGTSASNDDRNFNQYGGKLRGGYEISSNIMPFAELEADTRVHDLKTDFSGFQRDSDGVTGKGGVAFKLTDLLTGEIAVGYTKRVYEDARLAEVQGLIGNGALIWTASGLTTVKFTASSSVGEISVPGASGALYRDVGVQIDHAFRRWLIGSVKLGYGNDDYVGLDRDDNRYSIGGALTYKFSRSWQLKGELRQDWLRSNIGSNNYSATSVLLGLRWQR